MKKKMKAQTLGLILGMNMAVACLVMQGCKAVKPGQELPPEPTTTTTVDVTTEPTPAPSAKAPGADIKTETTPPPPPPPTTREIGKLPPPPKAEPAKKPASAPSAAPAAAAAESPVVHTVQRGELLSSISKKYNVKMSAIVAANPGLNPDRIRIGQKLKIPAKAAVEQKSGVMLASAPAPKAANIAAPVKTKPAFKAYTGPTKDYVVKGGDSLGKIALENGITIRALKEMNGLKKDNVRVGQKLKVPAEKPAAEWQAAPAPPPAGD
jgi:LysM repeat protein